MSQYPPMPQPYDSPEPSASGPGYPGSSPGELQPYSAPGPFAHPSAPGQFQQPMYAQPMYVMPPAQKDTAVTYLLAIFLGHFGVHNFYLGRIGAGVGQLILWFGSFATLWLGIGFIGLIAFYIWWIVDLCTIPGVIRGINEQRIREFNARNGHYQQPGYGAY